MSNYDPDAYLQGASDAPAYDPDAYLSQSSQPAPIADARTRPSATQHASDVLSIVKQHPLTTSWGLAENALSGVTGGAGSLADALTGSDPGTHDWAYRPRTEAGQAIAKASADEGAAVGRGYDWAVGTGPLAATVKDRVPEALGAVGTVTGLAEVPRAISAVQGAVKNLTTPGPIYPPGTTAAQILETSAAESPQSMGAASAAPKMSAVSPGLQKAVVDTARKTGGAVNAETLNRHIEADSLPVKIQLTPGQASQEPALISSEMNNRARTPGLPDLLDRQNKSLTQNIQAIRDNAGPDVFTTNPVEHGASLIEAYQAKDAPIKADITAKYKALEDANGGQFPLDTNGFVKGTDAALSKALKSNSVPSDLAATLNEFRNGRQMTFEDFESLRSDAADAARTSTDGRQRAAAGIIRDQLEKMPLTEEAAKLKPLADAARAAAKARFDALDADPAYDAAVHGTVPEDRFVQRFVTGPSATRNGVATMRQNLADNPTATQTMSVAALDHLRSAAGIDPMGNGNFTQAGFNKALVALDPKLQFLVDPKTAEHLSTLGNVARYTQAQPRGSFVNNSNTLVGALGEHAATAAENLVNAKTGIGGTLIRKAVEKRAVNKLAQKTMTPYGGLERLSDVAKP